MSYFDSPQRRPRYCGWSDPFPRAASDATMAMARTQAMHRMLLDWAGSPDREHWLPELVELRVVEDGPELFIRDKQAITARAHGKPVFDSDEFGRTDAPLTVVRGDAGVVTPFDEPR